MTANRPVKRLACWGKPVVHRLGSLPSEGAQRGNAVFKKLRIRYRTYGYLNHVLSTKQRSEINHTNDGMRERIPRPVWREMPVEGIAARYVWEIVEAGIVSFESLNLRGLDAWRLANDQVHQGVPRTAAAES